MFRDFGNRSDRKRARLKYIIHDWGLPAFRAKIEEYLGRPLADPRAVVVTDVDDHMGWHEQGDGKWFLGIPVENGRLKDEGRLRLFSGLRTFFERYRVPARLTCQQSILLADLDPAWRTEIHAWLEEYGIATVERISNVRRWAMACPALPTCGLAVTEAERALPSLLDELESEFARLGLADERLTVRMTGCPNGCARPYNADIGLVGRSAHVGPDGKPGPGTYTIFLGGRTIGDRLNIEFKDYVPHDQIVPTLVPVLQRFQSQRQNGETFGEFCARVGVEQLAESLGSGVESTLKSNGPRKATRIMIGERERSALLLAAQEAAARAYCPYSKFPVGAAILTDQSKIFTGCNVENASYGLTICAERCAIFQAIVRTSGPLRIKAVLVYTPTQTPTAPCGACRQVLNEFGPDAEIYSVCDGLEFLESTLKDLLPRAFGPHNLSC